MREESNDITIVSEILDQIVITAESSSSRTLHSRSADMVCFEYGNYFDCIAIQHHHIVVLTSPCDVMLYIPGHVMS